MRRMMVAAMLLLAGAEGSETAPGRGANPAAVAAFRGHVQRVEAAIGLRVRGPQPFLWVDDSPARLARVRRGEIVAEPAAGDTPIEVPGGLVHDCIGAVFIPGARLEDTLALVQDYDRHKDFYPEVIDSKLLAQNGSDFTVFLRLRKRKVITVVLDTIHDARYVTLDAARACSRSQSRTITEVQNPGTPNERQLGAGESHGFMWFLNSYWRFAARDGGVYVECQAVSLSRGVPWGLGWLIGPIVNDLPGESLAGTLRSTRDAVVRRAAARSR